MMDVLNALGVEWRSLPKDSPLRKSKMADRARKIEHSLARTKTYLPEYLKGGYSVLDISCGAGIDLEIFRHYGNDIMGADLQYFPFMESQGVPYVDHDCCNLPYPFPDKSYDLVCNVGSISNYHHDWLDVLDEFFRIARKTVFFVPNMGQPFEDNKDRIPGHIREWKRTPTPEGVYKWERTHVA
jgi:SAM-dependent methyltransferase